MRPQGGGMAAPGATAPTTTAITPGMPSYLGSEWYPKLMGLLQGRVGGMQRDWANQNISQLSRLLGGQFSRQNIAIPSGTDALARKYLAGQNQINPMDQFMQMQKLAALIAPQFQSWWGAKEAPYRSAYKPEDFIGGYLDRILGGGR